MGNPAWHIITSLYGFAGFVGIILLIVHRNNPYIKFRDFRFLMAQCIGQYVAVLINTIYLAERPDFSCYAYYFGSLLAYCGFLLPLAIRLWEYCVNFHISKIRSKVRDNVLLPNWGDESWFFRNRWVIRPMYLNAIFVFFFFALLTPLIPYITMVDEREYVEKTGTCKVPFILVIITFIIALIMFSLSALMIYLMKGSRDTYYVKQEIYLLAGSWAVCLAGWIPFTLISSPILKTVSGAFFILMGELFSTVWCCFLPLFLVYRKPIVMAQIGDANANGEFKRFVEQLENMRYRNALHDFLKLQFCQENIIFYEAVMNWKRMDAGSQKDDTARFIHTNYVLEEGICQVNLPAEMRNRISKEIKSDSIPDNIFDPAMKEVLEMIFTNSLISFSSHPLYKNIGGI